ncbi:DNA gyrase subunit A [Plasmodium gonderi]|uniref:DNA topoisomerase (ATP-hydrolyzing) n=1 Tax=Plasmodium gonderi TaxID=77519 RepID=A0A1Y1JMB7_PLAGO|nr:DNA gyrase subunit A [Plasmodium gonderi]GAW83609.1 DNA gyrase subunit A [Plasmodium gonderi]
MLFIYPLFLILIVELFLPHSNLSFFFLVRSEKKKNSFFNRIIPKNSPNLFINSTYARVKKNDLKGRIWTGNEQNSNNQCDDKEYRQTFLRTSKKGKCTSISGSIFILREKKDSTNELPNSNKNSNESSKQNVHLNGELLRAQEGTVSNFPPNIFKSNGPTDELKEQENPNDHAKRKSSRGIGDEKMESNKDLVEESVKRIKGEYYDVEICELLSKSFLSYANFLILNRCLCDYRDGLKTVQRRIIWSMYEINKGIDKRSYKKCARIVGEVIGKYHPHGDKSVYDALVRLAQKHHNNNLLINGYGNFGSVEYNAAAMRYTEARISNFCYDVLLDEINDENIEYVRNFDGNEIEPKVLCSKIPLLLINGCSGIAVSILSNIPCHNLIDVINCTISFLVNSNITEDQLSDIIKGPDFSTGGIIVSKQSELKNIYHTGKGNIEIRSNVFFEYMKNNKLYTNHINDFASLHSSDVDNKGSKKLIIKNLPPNVKPNELIESIINVLNERKNEHDNILVKILDESEKEDMRIVLELRKHSQLEQIQNFLSFIFRYTQMQITYHCNFVCIGHKNSYTQFSLKSFIQLWCENRIKFIKKNLQIKNQNLLKDQNIIELYILIQKKIVEIISFFQKNKNIEEIKNFLKNNFQLNDYQIQHILSMKIQKLINIKNVDFETQKNKIIAQIRKNEELIANLSRIKALIIQELIYIKNKYGINHLTKQVSPQSVKYKYTYINHTSLTKNQDFRRSKIDSSSVHLWDVPISFQENSEDIAYRSILNGENLSKINDSHNPHEEEKENKTYFYTLPNEQNQGQGDHDESASPSYAGHMKEKKNEKKKTEEKVHYRNTYIDSMHTNVEGVYNNDHVLILITYGGYVKKIKIIEKLKNHLNNTIKLSNVKYILKENEEKLNEGMRQKIGEQISTYPNDETSLINITENGENLGEEKINSSYRSNSYKIKKSILCRNRDKLLLTDNHNKAYILNVCNLHPSSYDSKGTPINQIINSAKNITGITKFEEDKKYLIVCSEDGKMKVINNDLFLKKKKKGIKLFKNKKNIHFSYCNFSDNCIVGTRSGYIIQFPLSNFKISKKNSLGNKCINLGKNDKVVDLLTYKSDENFLKNFKIIFLSKAGYGKMINLDELKIQKKKGKGYKIMKFKKEKNKILTNNDLPLSSSHDGIKKREEIEGTEGMKGITDDNIEMVQPLGNDMSTKKKQCGKKNSAQNTDTDEFLGFKLYDMTKKKDSDLLIMITDHAVLIRKNISLLKKKNRKHSLQIYAKLSKLNRLVYFDIM